MPPHTVHIHLEGRSLRDLEETPKGTLHDRISSIQRELTDGSIQTARRTLEAEIQRSRWSHLLCLTPEPVPLLTSRSRKYYEDRDLTVLAYALAGHHNSPLTHCLDPVNRRRLGIPVDATEPTREAYSQSALHAFDESWVPLQELIDSTWMEREILGPIPSGPPPLRLSTPPQILLDIQGDGSANHSLRLVFWTDYLGN